jgi:hypothetical protein
VRGIGRWFLLISCDIGMEGSQGLIFEQRSLLGHRAWQVLPANGRESFAIYYYYYLGGVRQ